MILFDIIKNAQIIHIKMTSNVTIELSKEAESKPQSKKI
jgi:hypothetical protein